MAKSKSKSIRRSSHTGLVSDLVRSFEDFAINGHLICGYDCPCLRGLRDAIRALEREMSKHAVQVFKIVTTTPGRIVEIVVRYPTHRPRGFVLEVDSYEQRDGMEERALTSCSRETKLADASRFNARKLESLVTAVRTIGTDENRTAEREYRAYMAANGYKALVSPFGDP